MRDILEHVEPCGKMVEHRHLLAASEKLCKELHSLCLKPGGYFMWCLNPEVDPEDEVTTIPRNVGTTRPTTRRHIP